MAGVTLTGYAAGERARVRIPAAVMLPAGMLCAWLTVMPWARSLPVATTLAAVAVATIVLAASARYGLIYALRWFWLFVAGLAVAALLQGWQAQTYGDVAFARLRLASPGPVNVTWFASFSFVHAGHALIGHYVDADFYLRVSAIAVMALTNTLALWRWPRLSVGFATITPLWFAFSSGYIEIYPYIAWVVLLCLAVFGENGCRNPYGIGLLCGVMPTLYMGFAPVAALMGLFFVIGNRNWRDWLKAGAVGLAAWLVMVRVFWGPDVISYLNTFLEVGRHWPSGNTDPMFAGIDAGDGHYWPLSYALSSEHLHDVAYTGAFGFGWHWLLLLALAAWYGLPAVRSSEWQRYAFFGVLWVWQAYYCLFFILRLGPRQDVDSNFIFYTLTAFLVGHLLQRAVDAGRLPERAVPAAVAFVLGANAVLVPILTFAGMPPAP